MRQARRLSAEQVKTLRANAELTLESVTIKEQTARSDEERAFYAGRRAIWEGILAVLPERGGMEVPDEDGEEGEDG